MNLDEVSGVLKLRSRSTNSACLEGKWSYRTLRLIPAAAAIRPIEAAS